VIVAESINTVRGLLSEVRSARQTVGFVPTMGAFHAGHLSLISRSVAENDFTLVSNFVNPLQFSPDEDFERYPRNLAQDNRDCQQLGVDLVFAPTVEEMFPCPAVTSIRLSGLTDILEGQHRPGHLEGVAMVVAKLFAIAGSSCAYFGEKDWQQLCLVRRLAADLSLPTKVVGCEIVREPDGLALSSRNLYLTARQRSCAAVLYQALRHGADLIAQNPKASPQAIGDAMSALITAEPEVSLLDYAVVVDAQTLAPPARLAGTLRLLVAAQVGQARLIDNLGVQL